MKGILLIIILFYFTGCRHYILYDRTGQKFKTSYAEDDYSTSFSKKNNYPVLPFNISNFKKDLGVNNHVEYITYHDVEDIKKQFSNFIIIFWNPDCPNNYPIEMADKLDSINIPTILISLSYDFDRIVSRLNNSNFKNRAIYFIPSGKINNYSNKMMIKQLSFVRDACPPCYKDYQGETGTCQALLYTNKQFPEVLFALDFNYLSKHFDGH